MAKPLPSLHTDDIIRLWANIIRKEPDDCWPWVLSTFNGYPQIRIKRDTFRVSRIVYYVHYSIDPGNLDICHVCDNPVCCNPKHLFAGTEADNLRDMTYKMRAGNPNGKITSEDLAKMHEMLRDGSNQIEIAQAIGVDASTISKWLSGRYRYLK